MVITTKQRRQTKQHISYSMINEFLACPRKYHLHRRLRLPPAFAPAALVFGSAVHEAIACYQQARLEGREAGEEKLQSVFARRWDREEMPVRFNKGEDADSMLDTAIGLISAFMETPADCGTPLAVEQHVKTRLSDSIPELWGVIDLLEETEEGLVLTDFKTASSRRTQDPAQLVLYKEALKCLGYPGAENAKIRYVVLVKNKKPVIEVQSPEESPRELPKLMSLFQTSWQAIEQGADHPVPSWQCNTCQWQHKCDQA